MTKPDVEQTKPDHYKVYYQGRVFQINPEAGDYSAWHNSNLVARGHTFDECLNNLVAKVLSNGVKKAA
jgi:hypothetical protein